MFAAGWSALEKRLLPSYVWTSDPLTFWRERILFLICFIAVVFGPIALVPSLLLAYSEGLWIVILVDSVAYMAAVTILIARNASFVVRALVICFILYALGVCILFILGPVGAGYIWLFGASVLITTFIGLGAAIWTLVFNTIVLLSVGIFIAYGNPEWMLHVDNALEKWLVMSTNFLLLNAFVTITTAFMLGSLKTTLLMEQKISKSLREGEDKFRTIFDRASDGILIADATTKKILQGNTAICSMLGYTKEEIENLTIYDIHPPKDIFHVLDEFEKQGKGEKILAEDLPVLRKDGSIFYANIGASPAIIGGVYCLLGLFHDITERKRAEEVLAEVNHMLQLVIDTIPVRIFWKDLNLTYLGCNLLFARDAGRQLPADLIGENDYNTGWREQADLYRQDDQEVIATGRSKINYEEPQTSPEGNRIWLRTSKVPLRNLDDRIIGILGTYEDITEYKRAEEELRLSEERFRRIFDEGPFGMGLESQDHTIIAVNKVLCELLGYTEQELAGQNIVDITYEEDKEKSKELLGQLFANTSPVLRLQKRYVKKNGDILWANTTISAVHGPEGNVLYGLAIIEDLTENKKAAEKIRLLAYYDSLTGLPNRTFHKELIKRSIEHAQRHKEIFALIYIGLDNFQRINDTLGHSIGDLLLKAVADRLTNSLRKSDYVARSDENETVNVISRVGGDEFIVLAHDLKQAQDAAKTSSRLLEEISAPYDLNGREVFITGSIGISLYPDDGTDVDDLLKNAEKAMRHTKSEGKNNYHFYSISMHSSVLALLTLENDLHRALERNELVLYYQPKVDATTRMVKGMEALIRWQHPNRGLIPPMKFIPLAETSGLIIPIGEFVIRTVCGQIKTWQEVGYKQVNIALNVSSRQFDQQNLIEIVKDALQDTMISPQCLEVEITESTIMRNPEKAIRILTELKAMGIQIAIDDFGTGYSSLSYLKRLPLDFLKIDQSFVMSLASDPRDQAIVKTTIAMAHSLDLKTIAEGVETEEQLSFLQEHGCDEIQGYLFSQPLPAQEIPGILAKGSL
jgi:diguanylate cyclase (GGDEF)-like protein/PAS domain S-box-containing protein